MADKLPRGRSVPFGARYDAAPEVIEAAGLPALDLRASLTAIRMPFLRADTHWSPQGAEAIANAVAAAVEEHGPILSEASTTLTATGKVPFQGDLLAFADTGSWAPYAGLAVAEIETFETDVETGSGLFGDAPVEVALVGTSFSARPDFHFAGFLKHYLRADVLNLAEVGLGPFAPMDRALIELPKLPTPPRLVIWEVPERYLALPETP